MVDRYTKAVLTAIAAALCLIALNMNMPTKASAFDESCGSSLTNPCYIEYSGRSGLSVYVTNWP